MAACCAQCVHLMCLCFYEVYHASSIYRGGIVFYSCWHKLFHARNQKGGSFFLQAHSPCHLMWEITLNTRQQIVIKMQNKGFQIGCIAPSLKTQPQHSRSLMQNQNCYTYFAMEKIVRNNVFVLHDKKRHIYCQIMYTGRIICSQYYHRP